MSSPAEMRFAPKGSFYSPANHENVLALTVHLLAGCSHVEAGDSQSDVTERNIIRETQPPQFQACSYIMRG